MTLPITAAKVSGNHQRERCAVSRHLRDQITRCPHAAGGHRQHPFALKGQGNHRADACAG